MKIVIIGCGFAGLSAALFLSNEHTITIMERFNTPEAKGAGILIQPSSQVILNKLNLLEPLLLKGEKIFELKGINNKNKQVFATYYKDYDQNSFGIGVKRSYLFNILYEKCKNNPNINFQLNTNIDNIENISKDYDLVIIASGSHTNLREQLPIKSSYRIYPYGCLWGMIKEEEIAKNHLQQYVKYSKEMFGLLPSGTDEYNNRIVSVFWSLPVKEKNTYDLSYIYECMRKYSVDKSVIDKIEKSNLTFATYADIFMKKYHYKNIVVIGDAAHGMSPQLGQGANMAFIDAYFLNEVLQKTNNLNESLHRYTILRKNHLQFYSQASKFLTPLFQSDNQLYGLIRDYLFSYSQQFSISRKMSSHILCGKKTSWFFNKEIIY